MAGWRLQETKDSQLSAHAAWAAGGIDVGGNSNSLEAPDTLCDGLAKSYSLGASPDWVRRILDVCSIGISVVVGQQGCADAELAVRAVSRRLGRGCPLLQLLHLVRRQAVLLGRVHRLRVIGNIENFRSERHDEIRERGRKERKKREGMRLREGWG